MKTTFVRVATTFALIFCGYVAYSHAFPIVADLMRRTPALDPAGTAPEVAGPTPSRTNREATRLAAEIFGKDHWTSNPDIPLRYYDPEHGYWMYAGGQERR